MVGQTRAMEGGEVPGGEWAPMDSSTEAFKAGCERQWMAGGAPAHIMGLRDPGHEFWTFLETVTTMLAPTVGQASRRLGFHRCGERHWGWRYTNDGLQYELPPKGSLDEVLYNMLLAGLASVMGARAGAG